MSTHDVTPGTGTATPAQREDRALAAALRELRRQYCAGERTRAEVERLVAALWPPGKGIDDHEVWLTSVAVEFDAPLPPGKAWRYREEHDFRLRGSTVRVQLAPCRGGNDARDDAVTTLPDSSGRVVTVP